MSKDKGTVPIGIQIRIGPQYPVLAVIGDFVAGLRKRVSRSTVIADMA